MRSTPPRRAFPAPPRRQRGVVLFIALIVLVAMTLAGIGMMRSVDTGTVVAGNLAFKQASIQAGDSGTEAAYQWLIANAGGTTLNNTNAAAGFISAIPSPEPNWYDSSAWTNAQCAVAGCGADAAGNIVSYVIHRLCTEPDLPYNEISPLGNPNQCAQGTSATAGGGSSTRGPAAITGLVTQGLYYRITSRIQGPRNTLSVIQTVVFIPL